jgi:hypothetical protein
MPETPTPNMKEGTSMKITITCPSTKNLTIFADGEEIGFAKWGCPPVSLSGDTDRWIVRLDHSHLGAGYSHSQYRHFTFHVSPTMTDKEARSYISAYALRAAGRSADDIGSGIVAKEAQELFLSISA